MALTDAEPGSGGNYFRTPDWVELGKEGALVVFRVVEIEAAGQKLTPTSKGTCDPVVADFLIVNGSREGEVRRSERIVQAGITGPLRQKAVGEDMAARIGIYGAGNAGANPAGPDGFPIIAALFAEHDNDPYSYFERLAKEAAKTDDDAPF